MYTKPECRERRMQCDACSVKEPQKICVTFTDDSAMQSMDQI